MIETWKLLCILGSVGFLLLWCCFNGFNKKRRIEQHNLAFVVVRPTTAPSTEIPITPRDDLPPPYEAAVKMPPPAYTTVCPSYVPPPPMAPPRPAVPS